MDTEQYDRILVENLFQRPGLPVTILRYPAVYGPNDYHRFGQWVQAMDRGETELKVQEDFRAWRWTHGFAENVAEAVALAATDPRAAGRIYNVGESQTPTWTERIGEIGHAAGWRARVVPVAASRLPEEERMSFDFNHDLVMDTSRIRAELGYTERVSRADTLARTIERERSSAAKT